MKVYKSTYLAVKTCSRSWPQLNYNAIHHEPVLLYGAETWTLTSSYEQALGVFERKILRKIYEPFCDRGEWRIRWNQELYDILYNILSEIGAKLQQVVTYDAAN